MLNRRSFVQGVLSLAALGPLARVIVPEKPPSIPAMINGDWTPDGLEYLRSMRLPSLSQRKFQAGPRIEETLYHCDDGKLRTLAEISGGWHFKFTWVDPPVDRIWASSAKASAWPDSPAP